MRSQESVSRLILIGSLVLVGFIAGAIWDNQNRILTLRARMPESGGWEPSELTAKVGEPLTIRLVSDDVTHSFAVGQEDFPVVDLLPGDVKTIDLLFDRPGKYTYYCTRWCGANHWRMRGTIEVVGEGGIVPVADTSSPLYILLGIDIDAPHPAQVLPVDKPEPVHEADLAGLLDDRYFAETYYQTHSPEETWQDLRQNPQYAEFTDQEIWSLVAAIWRQNTTLEELGVGKSLYAANCAACHGENGTGDGVFAYRIAGLQEPGNHLEKEHGLQTPTDFTDKNNMLGASPALLHGKIVRGGMGTGMPYWGPIFTEHEIWSLVDFLWTFQFEYSLEVK